MILNTLRTDSNNKSIELIEALRLIEPNMIKLIEKRYNILRVIDYINPIGRRNLANKINLSERVTRNEAKILKEQGLIEINSDGMNITPIGKDIIEKLTVIFHDIKGLKNLEERLENILGIKKSIIVPGSVDEDSLVYKDIGRASYEYIKSIIKDGNVIGLTGGSTVAYVVEEFKALKDIKEKSIIVPARGGLGNRVEYQANTLVEILAKKIGCMYKTLYTPDYLLSSTIESLKKESFIGEIVELYDKLDVLIFGIGRADVMAKRRGLTSEDIKRLEERKAVAEAFGYYFNEAGEIVHEVSTIGISLEQFKRLESPIAVASGVDKTEAIISVCSLNNNIVLITDELVANRIILKGGIKNDCKSSY